MAVDKDSIVSKFLSLPEKSQGLLSIVGVNGVHSIANGALWGFVSKSDLREAPSIKLAMRDSSMSRYWGYNLEEDGSKGYVVEINPESYYNVLYELYNGEVDDLSLEEFGSRAESLRVKSFRQFYSRLDSFYNRDYANGVRELRLGIYSSNASNKATTVSGQVIDSYQIDLETLVGALKTFTENTSIMVAYRFTEGGEIFDPQVGVPEVMSKLGSVRLCKNKNALEVIIYFS